MTAHSAIGAPPLVAHGGRLDAARRLFPDAPQPWIDLSTGVNPRAYPLPPLDDEVFTRLPDDDAFAALDGAARKAYGAPAGADVVPGGGAQAFIQMLPRVFPAKRVAILGFTYAEHAACWAAMGAQVEMVETIDALANADVGVIVAPNNPDGRVVGPQDILSAATQMSQRGLLIVDESFMDFTPEASVAGFAQNESLVVLRSFGKAYGLPGLRLGFALCSRARGAKLRAALGPWAVSGPALAIGARALADQAWRIGAARACAGHAARLDALLTQAGFHIMGGTTLFRLAANPQAPRWFAHLAARGILTRGFADRPDWLRFGLPPNEAAWARLAAALESVDGD
ncbi:threonine-phosphate decarboxylase [Methylocystis sp. H4A]|jgi:cobalamin biosynthetic protein CobC|uniref:threonine-phosphate decarboxylase CobD n=1 Tax=Methylocystis sp. H4A TaxID=2785788 RepID=UPI0018C34EAA|nr:threonine-phosphate decarboxylase CobD [Methylocystis sp. H4A]MBG0803120.1 threonine-phosphate decarboxylase [Methylocystis sp. H4A]